MRCRLWTILAFVAFCSEGVHADFAEVQALQAERLRLVALTDSLSAWRAGLAGRADLLSARIDSLKAGSRVATASGDLQAALRGALSLAERIEEADGRMASARQDLLSLEERLRLACDREIGRAVEGQGKASDAALLQRVRALQEIRESLGHEAGADRGPSEAELPAIREDDGPDEIRQKADLVADMASRAAAEAQGVARRLARLAEERRLRRRVASFAQELSLFDENLPEGRALSAGKPREQNPEVLSGSAGDNKAQEGVAPPAEGGAGGAADAPLVTGMEAAPAVGGRGSLEGLNPDDLALEIQALKARQTALQKREQWLWGQMAAFRKRLAQMLEEGK